MIKVISCAIFKPYIEQLTFDNAEYVFQYLDIHQHNSPLKLAKAIQNEIDHTSDFDIIIILYGVCGGALLSLKARDIPLVVVKVHDCMSVLLGSKKKYEQITSKTKSISWSCYSLKEENYFNDNLSTWNMLYDEETVEYLKSMLLQDDEYYISFDLPEERKYLNQENQIIKGDLEFLNQIILLDSHELLLVYPHQRIKQTLDNDVIKVID